MTDILDSNSDTRPFELSQFGAWLLLDGIRERLTTLESWDICWVETIETELARVESWSSEHSPWYSADDFAELWAEIAAAREWCERSDSEWYAQCARENFTVIEGGKS